MARLGAALAGFVYRHGLQILHFSRMSILAAGPTPSISLRVNCRRLEVDHLPSSKVGVKYEWSCTSASTVCRRGVDSDNRIILFSYHRKSCLSGTLFSGTFHLTACVSVLFIAPYSSYSFPYIYLASNNQRM